MIRLGGRTLRREAKFKERYICKAHVGGGVVDFGARSHPQPRHDRRPNIGVGTLPFVSQFHVA